MLLDVVRVHVRDQCAHGVHVALQQRLILAHDVQPLGLWPLRQRLEPAGRHDCHVLIEGHRRRGVQARLEPLVSQLLATRRRTQHGRAELHDDALNVLDAVARELDQHGPFRLARDLRHALGLGERLEPTQHHGPHLLEEVRVGLLDRGVDLHGHGVHERQRRAALERGLRLATGNAVDAADGLHAGAQQVDQGVRLALRLDQLEHLGRLFRLDERHASEVRCLETAPLLRPQRLPAERIVIGHHRGHGRVERLLQRE